jgi:hypothetical protein
MKTVGEKIRISQKQARRIIQSFEQSGYLTVVGNAHGGAPGATKQFKLNVELLKQLADEKLSTPPTGVTPPIGVPRRLPPVAQTTPIHGSLTTIEPSIEPPIDTRCRDATGFELPDWINIDHWNTWHSTTQRRKASDLQKQMAVKKLSVWRDGNVDHHKALENAAMAGWRGLFEPTVNPTKARVPLRHQVPNLQPGDIGEIPDAE